MKESGKNAELSGSTRMQGREVSHAGVVHDRFNDLSVPREGMIRIHG
ncbi:MAG: hypothetical protein V1766_13930 [Pseudomonadota bacterium]